MRGSVLSIYLGIIIGIGDELEGAGVSYFGVVGLCCCGYETESIFYDRLNTFLELTLNRSPFSFGRGRSRFSSWSCISIDLF